MQSTEKTYQAYLLRLWRDGADGPWRASLQSTKESRTQLFADVSSLIAFLEAQTGTSETAATRNAVTPLVAPTSASAPYRQPARWAAWGSSAVGRTDRPQSPLWLSALAFLQEQQEKLLRAFQGWNHRLTLVGTFVALLALFLMLQLNSLNPVGLVGTAIAPPQPVTPSVMAWGEDSAGQLTIPATVYELVAVAAGYQHSVGLKADGTVVTWGETKNPPADLTNVVAIAAGRYHNLALKDDGTVVAWGDNLYGQVPVPAGLHDVTAIAATEYHNVALKRDGTVVAWGDNSFGNLAVPADLQDVVAIAASVYHSLALKRDGTVVAWGDNRAGGLDVPTTLHGVTAIAAGEQQSLALLRDGTVVDWGSLERVALPDGLTQVTAIAAAYTQSAVLQADGTITWLGRHGVSTLAPPAELTTLRTIAVGAHHLLALR
ncbi:MAG: hypothetical protein KF832_29240 [Caldilineaceae bacterium]|nr:hypothetical protein [Caldilineaceae bacterium]